MRSRKAARPSALVIILVSLLVQMACGGSETETGASSSERSSTDVLSLTPEIVRQGELEVLTVGTRSLHETLEAAGRIGRNEDHTARVGSPAEGRVTRIFVSLGEAVEQGAPLVQIHSHELIVARSDYSKATTALSATERRLRFARAERDRAQRLFAAKALSDRENQAAASELDGAQAEWERAQAELDQAEHYLMHLGVSPDAEIADGDLTVRAPLAGVVLERQVTLGTVVSPTNDLILLTDLDSLWVDAEVPEREASRVTIGQSAEVEVAAFPGETFEARIFHIADQLDAVLRTVSVRAIVDNSDRRLRPGMYAAIQIASDQSPPVIAVPERAIQRFNDTSVVFVALGEEKFERRTITTARDVSGWIEVLRGLASGERIVGDGSFLIKSEFLRNEFEEEG